MLTPWGAATSGTSSSAAASAGPSRRSRKSHPRVSKDTARWNPPSQAWAPPRPECRAIAGQPAQCRRHADGPSRIRADGGNRRTLLHAGRASAGRPSCECLRIPRLCAVAVLAVLAGDAVSQLMQMRLAHDHGAGRSQPRGHGGVSRCDAVLGRIEMRAASGRVARDIEAIFNPDGNAEERRPLRRLGEAGGERLRFRQYPFAIHRQVHIPPDVAVSARQRFLRRNGGLLRRQGCFQWAQERHIGLCIPCPDCTRSPVNDLNFPMTVENC